MNPRKKKKIVIFGVKYFPARGGTSRVVENLLRELHEEFDFTIYCYRHPEAAALLPGVRTVQFAEIPIKGAGVFLYYLRCCLHLLLRGRAELVHLHKTDGALFIPLLSRRFPVMATSHALPYLNEKWSVVGKLYFRWMEGIFMRSRAMLSSISQTQADYYSQKYGRPVAFIPNGIHIPARPDPEAIRRLKDQYQIQGPYLLFAARRVIPLKGAHHLLEALHQINYTGTLVIAGDMDQLPEYSRRLKDLADGLKVKFIGYIAGMERLSALIRGAQLFVFPSEIEGMSMMLLEAGSLGTPMVVSDIPQNTAVLDEGEVLFFKSKDVADLACRLQWALDHPQEMQQLAAKAGQRIQRDYLMRSVARRYADLYHQYGGLPKPVKTHGPC